MLWKIIQSKSKTFLAFCFFFLGGVVLASVIKRRFDFVYFYFVWLTLAGWIFIFSIDAVKIYFKRKLSAGAIVIARSETTKQSGSGGIELSKSTEIASSPPWAGTRSDRVVRFTLFCLFFASLGFARYHFAIIQKEIGNINYYNGQDITFDGTIIEEPDIREDKAIYIVNAKTVRGNSVAGRVYIDLNPQPRYSYGDNLTVSCSIKAPLEIDKSFAMYLATKNISAVCWSPGLRLNSSGGGNKVIGAILGLKNVINIQTQKLWHEPYASFMAGILYGYKGGLGKAGEMFQKTGTTHILAVSGQNISIIANVLITACIYLWIPRKKAFYLICTGIIFFVLLTGMSSSAVRAGVMAILLLISKQVGRQGKSLNLMFFAASVMVLQNPFVLTWDVGFQLSFLSSLGILLMNPIFSNYLQKIPDLIVVKESLITTASATIFTMPIILYSFGQISLVSVLVNVLILWAIPILMFTGFISIISGLLYFPLGDFIAWLPWFGMRYVFIITNFFANLKFSSYNFQLPLLGMLAGYAAIFYLVWRFSPNWRKSNQQSAAPVLTPAQMLVKMQ